MDVGSLFLPASIWHLEAIQLFKYLQTLIIIILCSDSGHRSFHVSGDGCRGAQGLLCCGAGCWHRARGHSGCPAGWVQWASLLLMSRTHWEIHLLFPCGWDPLTELTSFSNAYELWATGWRSQLWGLTIISSLSLILLYFYWEITLLSLILWCRQHWTITLVYTFFGLKC